MKMPTHTDFLAEAIRLSIANVQTSAGGPFGAVIVRDGEILVRGANAVTATNDPTAHAEIVAIRAACTALGDFELRGCILYSSCEPCPMCLAAAYWARLEAVYFAATQDDAASVDFDDAFLYRELALPHAARSLPIFHVPQQQTEARAAFAAWQASLAKEPY
jgi:guanine deaminase